MVQTDELPRGARITGGYRNTESGREHYKVDEKGVVDFGFSIYVLIRRILFILFKR